MSLRSYGDDAISEGVDMKVQEELEPLTRELKKYKIALQGIVALEKSGYSDITRWRMAKEIAEEALTPEYLKGLRKK